MKSYSADTISPSAVDAKVRAATAQVNSQISEVDAKQSEQIKKLRFLLAASAAVNLLVAVGAYFF